MKRMNFPGRKKLRQINARKRLEETNDKPFTTSEWAELRFAQDMRSKRRQV